MLTIITVLNTAENASQFLSDKNKDVESYLFGFQRTKHFLCASEKQISNTTPKNKRKFLKILSLILRKEHLIFKINLRYLPQNQTSDRIEAAENRPKRDVRHSCVLEKKISSALMQCGRCQSFTCKNSTVKWRVKNTIRMMSLDE